jgi:hypothetical protein
MILILLKLSIPLTLMNRMGIGGNKNTTRKQKLKCIHCDKIFSENIRLDPIFSGTLKDSGIY